MLTIIITSLVMNIVRILERLGILFAEHHLTLSRPREETFAETKFDRFG